MKDIYPILKTCSLFSKIPESEYENILLFLNATRKTFRKDSTVINIGDSSTPSGIVLKGKIEISLLDENAREINVTHIEEGKVFGMAMACAMSENSLVSIKTLQDSEILFLSFKNILNPTNDISIYKSQIAANLLKSLARKTVFLNHKVRIIGQKKLRDKIKIFLSSLSKGSDGYITLPFNRNEMADYLYADRSALSRELSRMALEGLLEFNGQKVKIIDKDFFSSDN